ncbi:MAG TPA: helix-turn-helix domain-containing protein, partial [Bacteroidales bacterium]|nr:helix-turn-helix domain-containing protein [Bacteroidales bacterium]
NASSVLGENSRLLKRLYQDHPESQDQHEDNLIINHSEKVQDIPVEVQEEVQESLSLTHREMDLIRRALKKHEGKRKDAASELGISERTLYRKIKEYGIE